jgi:hypothetical protein
LLKRFQRPPIIDFLYLSLKLIFTFIVKSLSTRRVEMPLKLFKCLLENFFGIHCFKSW